MLSWVVRNLYGIQLKAAVALSYVIDPGDVGALFINHLHKLWKANNEAQLEFNLILAEVENNKNAKKYIYSNTKKYYFRYLQLSNMFAISTPH